MDMLRFDVIELGMKRVGERTERSMQGLKGMAAPAAGLPSCSNRVGTDLALTRHFSRAVHPLKRFVAGPLQVRCRYAAGWLQVSCRSVAAVCCRLLRVCILVCVWFVGVASVRRGGRLCSRRREWCLIEQVLRN